MNNKILILGDFNPDYHTHRAINESLIHSQKLIENEIRYEWVDTNLFDIKTFGHPYFGMLIAPGSPYKNMNNVLSAINFTRLNNIPTLGNCGGFQHMIIEFARNVCGLIQADHGETNPNADNLIISKLSCSLLNQEEEITIIDSESHMYKIYGRNKFKGSYFCSFGLNENYINLLLENGCSFTAISPDGNTRVFELKSHQFFIGTLFQPALTSSPDEPNPIILEFIKQCIYSD